LCIDTMGEMSARINAIACHGEGGNQVSKLDNISTTHAYGYCNLTLINLIPSGYHSY